MARRMPAELDLQIQSNRLSLHNNNWCVRKTALLTQRQKEDEP